METGTYIKTTVTRMRAAISGLENLILILVAVVTIFGVLAISGKIQTSSIKRVLVSGTSAEQGPVQQQPPQQ